MPAPPLTSTASAPATLTFTGERFLPEVRGAIWYEHWHRYAAVAPLAAGQRVLDAACGEGYGSHLLAQAAAAVTGVDVSADAVAHATRRYARGNLRFIAGSVTRLPLADASVDLVVSFETIEHLSEQREMLAEFRRVLDPAGALIISSPNRPVYNDGGGVANHYHIRELDRAELAVLLAPGFPQQAWYGQRVIAQSALWAESEGGGAAPASCVTLVDDRPVVTAAAAPPMYFIVICAAKEAALPTLPALSLYDDGALTLWRDYVGLLEREADVADARNIAAERLAELIVAVNDLASAREASQVRVQRIAALEDALATTQQKAQAALDSGEAALREAREALQREAQAHARTRARLLYRESVLGWLRFPFAAVRHLLGRGRR